MGMVKQAGAALVIALVALIVLTVLGLSTMGDMLTQSSSVRNEQLRQRVFYAASSELNATIKLVNNNPSTADDPLILGLLDSPNGPDEYQMPIGVSTNYPFQTSLPTVSLQDMAISGRRNDLLGCSGESVGHVKVLSGEIDTTARLNDGKPNGGIRSIQRQRFVYCWPK